MSIAGDTMDRSKLGGDLGAALTRIAQVPQLFIGCDYDGTLAPLVDDPTKASPLPEAVFAVRSLALLPQTTVAVVSGRALRDLATLSRLPNEIHLIGSHGSEFDLGFVQQLAPELLELHQRVLAELTSIARAHEGVEVETKPASVALHVRRAGDPANAARALDAVRNGPARWPGVHVTYGHEVVELSVVVTNKGVAVTTLRGQTSASAVLYLGDDITDENVFALLHGPDVGIKIGPGPTEAAYRVDEPVDAVRALAFLLERRRQWLFGEHAVPIERHTMLSNGSTVALLTPDARVSWLCHPRPDSAAVFADIVGGAGAGYFSADTHSRRPAPRSALSPENDDRRDAMVGNHGHRLAGRRGGRGRRPVARALLDAGSRADRYRLRPGRVRPATGVRTGPDHARVHRARAPGARLERADHGVRERCRLGDDERRRTRDGTRRDRPRHPRRKRRDRAPLRIRGVHPSPLLDRRASNRRRAPLNRMGRQPRASEDRPQGGAAERSHAPRSLPRSNWLDSRGGDDLSARGARRSAQLGLPVLLAPRRRIVSAGPRRPGITGRSRSTAEVDRRVCRPDWRASGATASALHRRRPRARSRGRHRHVARLRGLEARSRRQRRQPPGPARRLRTDHRSGRSSRGSAWHRPKRGVAVRRGNGGGRRAPLAGSQITASGRRASHLATTSTRRSCAG